MNDLILKARVSGFTFISVASAKWLAVETLIACKVSKTAFDRTYTSMLACEFEAFLYNERDKMSTEEKKEAFELLMDSYPVRHEGARVRALTKNTFQNDLAGLGNVLKFFMEGNSKSKSISSAVAKHRKFRPKLDRNEWTRPIKSLSFQTMEGLWAQYRDVLPYVYIYTQREWAHHINASGPSIAELDAAVPNFRRQASLNRKTQAVNLEEMSILEFE